MKQLFNTVIINGMITLTHKPPPLEEIYSPEAKNGYNKTWCLFVVKFTEIAMYQIL